MENVVFKLQKAPQKYHNSATMQLVHDAPILFQFKTLQHIYQTPQKLNQYHFGKHLLAGDKRQYVAVSSALGNLNGGVIIKTNKAVLNDICGAVHRCIRDLPLCLCRGHCRPPAAWLGADMWPCGFPAFGCKLPLRRPHSWENRLWKTEKWKWGSGTTRSCLTKVTANKQLKDWNVALLKASFFLSVLGKENLNFVS